MNNSIQYKGRLARANVTNNIWYLEAFGGQKEGKTSSYSSNNGDLLTTGASKQTERYHIYDVAGNLWEWTDEVSIYKSGNANETNNQYRNVRGGAFRNPSSTNPVCYRIGLCAVDVTSFQMGFRVVLYIK